MAEVRLVRLGDFGGLAVLPGRCGGSGMLLGQLWRRGLDGRAGCRVAWAVAPMHASQRSGGAGE